MPSKRKLRRRIQQLEAQLLDALETKPLPASIYVPVLTGQSASSGSPFCSICKSWHTPGMGACTGTYSVTSDSTGTRLV